MQTWRGKLDCFKISEVNFNMENINSWKDIRWRDIEKKIFHLQVRIFKAAANQKLEKMYKLQKLLISSKSAKYLSVKKVTEKNFEKSIPEINRILIPNSSEKFRLANKLILDGKSDPSFRVYVSYPNRKYRPLRILTIEERAKQMLAYLALCPQWEAQFESSSYGFRPNSSICDVMRIIYFSISTKPKWVLSINISKCFKQINDTYLLEKCNTFPKMKQQIRAWLKSGILNGEEFVFPEMRFPQGGVILPLLVNIALHGLQDKLYMHIRNNYSQKYQQSLKFIRYLDNFILMDSKKETLEDLKYIIKQFLEPIGLKLDTTKTRIVHTLENSGNWSPGFSFLGFDIIQRQKKYKQFQIKVFKTTKYEQNFITYITPSKEEVQIYKVKIRKIIRSHKGASQEKLIQVLNPIIKEWSNLKRSQTASNTFQAIDAYILIHLWKWARKRHPKMSKIKLKNKYWHQVKNQNWIFGIKKSNNITIKLQLHSKILIKRHNKVKKPGYSLDTNFLYCSRKTGKSLMLPSYYLI